MAHAQSGASGMPAPDVASAVFGLEPAPAAPRHAAAIRRMVTSAEVTALDAAE
jgi:hypothetical protein